MLSRLRSRGSSADSSCAVAEPRRASAVAVDSSTARSHCPQASASAAIPASVRCLTSSFRCLTAMSSVQAAWTTGANCVGTTNTVRRMPSIRISVRSSYSARSVPATSLPAPGRRRTGGPWPGRWRAGRPADAAASTGSAAWTVRPEPVPPPEPCPPLLDPDPQHPRAPLAVPKVSVSAESARPAAHRGRPCRAGDTRFYHHVPTPLSTETPRGAWAITGNRLGSWVCTGSCSSSRVVAVWLLVLALLARRLWGQGKALTRELVAAQSKLDAAQSTAGSGQTREDRARSGVVFGPRSHA